MTPQQRYQHDLQQNLISPDEQQQFVVLQLQKLFDQLIAENHKPKFLQRLSTKWWDHVVSENEYPQGFIFGVASAEARLISWICSMTACHSRRS